ncbi:MAG: putative two-component response regulator [Actinomycetia bacterium]|nr:putative two-component response regulator [Actinomycetes bacterium]
MADILLATDADWVVAELRAAVEGPDTTVRAVRRGEAVPAALREHAPDLVVLDLQIGNMGGMATCVHLHLEAEAGRLPAAPILMLLDRRPDVFLARRSGADGFILKPLDAIRLRKAVTALLAGGTYEDPTGAPIEVPGTAAVG